MAQLSTSMCSTLTSGYPFATRSTVARHSLLVSSTLDLSTLVMRFLRVIASSNAILAMRSTSLIEYTSVSYASCPSAPSRYPRSPKYIPPVSSRTIIISTPFLARSGRSGLVGISSSYSTAGRRLANSFMPARRLNKPFSGRMCAFRSFHLGPPTAPKSTASDLLQAVSVSGGSGTPVTSIALPPIGMGCMWKS